MHSLSLAEFLQAAASALAAGRLLHLGFRRTQSALLAFLSFNSLYLITLANLAPRSHGYFTAYLIGTVVSWVVSVFAVREMFALTFDQYPGIRTVGRWVLYSAIGLASVVSVAITLAITHGGGRGSTLLYYCEILNRAVMFPLAVAIIAILILLSRYPMHLSHNTYVSTCFFSAVFLSEAAVTVIDNLSQYLYSNWTDVTQVLFAAACFIGWTVMLRPEPTALRVIFENPAEHELLRQLDSINRLLSRTGRR